MSPRGRGRPGERLRLEPQVSGGGRGAGAGGWVSGSPNYEEEAGEFKRGGGGSGGGREGGNSRCAVRSGGLPLGVQSVPRVESGPCAPLPFAGVWEGTDPPSWRSSWGRCVTKAHRGVLPAVAAVRLRGSWRNRSLPPQNLPSPCPQSEPYFADCEPHRKDREMLRSTAIRSPVARRDSAALCGRQSLRLSALSHACTPRS